MLETIRLICDSGLLVLIWIVQLIIYPSFSYYKHEDLHKWHTIYTKRIAIVVIPLMTTQLVVSSIQIYLDLSYLSLLYLIMVLLAWISTFLIFVPLHDNISKKKAIEQSIKKLKLHNWLRTILWSFIFILTCYIETTLL